MQKHLIVLFVILNKFISCQYENNISAADANSPNLIEPIECGQGSFQEDNNDIRTIIGEHPWIVGLGYWYSDRNEIKIDCPGVLISKQFVLSKGGCIEYYGDEILAIVRLGIWNLSSSIIEKNCIDGVCADIPIDIGIENTFTRYDSQWPWRDNIGLIQLSEDVQYSKWIQPICLPNPAVHENIRSYFGAQFITGGWSKNMTDDGIPTGIRLKRPVMVNKNTICVPFIGRPKYDSFYHFCTTNTEACDGDGPIMGIDTSDPDKPYWYIFGFLSLLPRGCEKQFPRVSTKVLPYLEWINNLMEEQIN